MVMCMLHLRLVMYVLEDLSFVVAIWQLLFQIEGWHLST